MNWGRRHRGSFAALCVAAGLIAAGPATAAIPASGSAPAGIGPSFGRIGTSGAKAVARLHLRCAPVSTGSAARRCYNGLRNAGDGFVSIDGAGRIEAWTFYTGRWNAGHGVGRGSTIRAVRRAFGTKLTVRVTKSWTYLTLRRTIAGQPRRTLFIGRTKYGDIVTLAIQRDRRNIIRAPQAVTPVGQDLVVNFIDFAPRATIIPELRVSGQPRSTLLPAIRTDARGAATLTLPRSSGTLAQWLATRPTAQQPLTLFVGASGVRGRTVTVQVAGAKPPALSYDLPVMSAATPGTLTITGPEPLATYVVSASWTCRDRTTGRVDEATQDPITSTNGADITAVPDVDAIRGGLFNADCTGNPTPATAPVTLTLLRRAQSGDAITLAPVTQITVTVSSVESPTA